VDFSEAVASEVGTVVAQGPSSVDVADPSHSWFPQLLSIGAFTLEELKEKSCPDGDERLCATGDGDLRVEKISGITGALKQWQIDDTDQKRPRGLRHFSFSISAGGKGLSGGDLSLSFSPIIGKVDLKLIKAELTMPKTTDISKPLIVDFSEAVASEVALAAKEVSDATGDQKAATEEKAAGEEKAADEDKAADKKEVADQEKA